MTTKALSADVWTVVVEGAVGGETITGTANHPFYSEDRNGFVGLAELAVDERVRSALGEVVWIARTPALVGRGTVVCNIEVAAEHHFLVGDAGVLVHNGCQGQGGGADAPNRGYGGGRFDDIGTEGGTLHRHHMPADSASPLSRGGGPAIQVEHADHRQTASYGGGPGSEQQAFRDRQRQLIDDGRFDDAFEMDIDDIQSKFGDKYDDAFLEAIDVLPKDAQ